MKEIEKLKETILKEYPRLDLDSKFQFKCHPGVPCFNNCCADINIFLTPYDIIRLKHKLGISSGEFLAKYTIMPFDENLPYPVVLLKMQDNEKKSCHFVGDKGCTVYNDRPWACRMYPLGLASPSEGHPDVEKEFYFLLKESVCRGFEENNEYNVSEWLNDQGIADYNEMGELFKNLTLHKFFNEKNKLEPQKIEMFFMACYHLDKFREFLFGSSFFNKFDIDEETQKKLKEDDLELLKLGYKWLHFALFGEKTLKIKEDVLTTKQQELKNRTEQKK
ncbi:MAG: YkgJ family cysteine cluster protein [Candidatus Zixiibacteriota bacterium]